MSSSSRIFSGVSWSIIMNIVNALYGFIMIPLLINHFGKAEYGLIGLAQSVNAYMRLMDLGLTATNVRFFANWLSKGDKEKVNRLFSTCTSFYGIVGLINAAVLITIYFFSESIFNVSPEQDVILKKLLLILSVSAVISWFTSCYNQLIQATENVAWTQKILLLSKLLMVVVLLLTISCNFSITLYFLLTVACTWVTLPIVVGKIKKLLPSISFIPKFDKSVFKEILPYTLNIFSFNIFSFSYNNLKPVFLGMQGTPEDVAEYKVLVGITGIVTSICSVFMTALLPTSSKVIAEGNKDAFDRIAYQGTKYLTIFVAFCVFGMMSISDDLLMVYVGESFSGAAIWLKVLLLTMLANNILAISSLILGGSNIRPLSIMTAVSSSLGLVFAWFLIPEYGVGGVVIASVIYCVLQQLFYYIHYFPHILKISSKTILLKYVLPVYLSIAAILIMLNYLPNLSNLWLNILLDGGCFCILFALFLKLYLKKEDISYFTNLLSRKHRS